METTTSLFIERGLLTLSDEAWERARQLGQVIATLAALEKVGHQVADDAAQQLGLSRRQVYVLVRRYRQGSGLVTDLVPGQSSGGKGQGRLPESVEHVIRELLRERFLTRQKRSLAMFYRDIVRACKAQGLPIPTRNTVALRIAKLDPVQVALRREGADAVRPLQSAGGVAPAIMEP